MQDIELLKVLCRNLWNDHAIRFTTFSLVDRCTACKVEDCNCHLAQSWGALNRTIEKQELYAALTVPIREGHPQALWLCAVPGCPGYKSPNDHPCGK